MLRILENNGDAHILPQVLKEVKIIMKISSVAFDFLYGKTIFRKGKKNASQSSFLREASKWRNVEISGFFPFCPQKNGHENGDGRLPFCGDENGNDRLHVLAMAVS